MGTFKSTKTFFASPEIIPAIVKDITGTFTNEGYQVQAQDLISGGYDISITKGNMFKAVLGMVLQKHDIRMVFFEERLFFIPRFLLFFRFVYSGSSQHIGNILQFRKKILALSCSSIYQSLLKNKRG